MTTKAQRNRSLTEAGASLRLEGLAFSEENADLLKAWADGSMNGDQIRCQIMSRAAAKAEAGKQRHVDAS